MVRSRKPQPPPAAAEPLDAAARAALLEAAGGALPIAEARALLGVTGQTVNNWRKEGRLIAIPVSRARFAYPAAQFGDGGVLPGLAEVLRASGLRDPWLQLRLLLTPATLLGGRTPLDALRAGHRHSALAVARAAARAAFHPRD